MPPTNDKRFSVGINYGTSATFWQDYDRVQARDDFAHMRALGFDAVRFFVYWNEIQPRADTVDAVLLDRITGAIALAADAGLRVLPSLAGTLRGRSHMPVWANALHDLYRGPLLDAQLVLARAIAERLRADPAIVAWDIGHAFSAARPPREGKISTGDHGSTPVAEHDVAQWARALGSVFRAAAIPMTAGTFSGDLTADTNVRFGSLCAPFAFASMQGSALPAAFARSRLDPEAVPFLAMVTAAFSFKRVLVTAAGNPAPPSGASSAAEREDENAAYAAAVLERLHADGRLGAYWWSWRDDDGDESGIVRRDGSERPVAAALAAFARQRRTLVAPRDMPMISSTYYYRTLPESAKTLFDAFLGFVEERREAPQPAVEKS